MKNNWRKIFMTLATLTLAGILVACGGAGPAASPTPPPSEEQGPDGSGDRDQNESQHIEITDLQFDFSGAIGLQIDEAVGMTTLSSGGSNLFKVMRDGSLEMALTQGTVYVNDFFIRNGKIYAILQPLDPYGESDGECVLAEITQDGDVFCLDTSISEVDIRSIQFDANGGVYYRGWTHDWKEVIRRSIDGFTIDFYRAQDATTIQKFVATRDGDVIIQGYTSGDLTSTYWTRVVQNNGRVDDIDYVELGHFLPDGSLLLGDLNRLLFHDGVGLDPRPYCGDDNARFNSHECWNIRIDEWDSHWYSYMGQVLVLNSDGLTRVFPSVEGFSLPLERITNGAVAMGKAVVSGYWGSGQSREYGAYVIDLDTNSATDILGGQRIEILRLIIRADEQRILMYGIDLDDRQQPVLAEYDFQNPGPINPAPINQELAEGFVALDWAVNHVPPEPSVYYVPEPDFNFDVIGSGPDAGVVAFDASKFVAPGTWVNQAIWDFGDGSDPLVRDALNISDYWLEVSHWYWEPGDYNVSLTLVDQLGETHTAEKIVNIPEFPGRIRHKVFDEGWDSGAVAFEVFVPESYPLASRVDFIWDFGDGVSTQVNYLLDGGDADEGHQKIAHRYLDPGAFDVTFSIVEQISTNPWAGNYGDEEKYIERIRSQGLTVNVHAANSPLIKRTSSGDHHVSALAEGGSVWTWGYNSNGQLGDGTVESRGSPVNIGLDDVVAIATGSSHSLAVTGDGSVWAWGSNNYGQLGNGTTINQLSPILVPGLDNIIEVAAGDYHSLAVTRDGLVWSWGYNYYGQLGVGETSYSVSPVLVADLVDVIEVTAGAFHSVAMTGDGDIWTWGHNSDGQLGDGTTSDRHSPVLISTLSDATMVATGAKHSLAITEDGLLWAWGYNGNGQLGDGTTRNRYTPTHIIGLEGVDRVAGSYHSSFAVTTDGTLWAWGNNNYGQLGNGQRSSPSFPAKNGMSEVSDVSTGSYHSLAVKGDGSVWASGDNRYGQLGVSRVREGQSEFVYTPRLVVGFDWPSEQEWD